MHAVGWWLDYSDKPAKSDLIVVLAGSPARPFYAADLYRGGFAPEIWLSRPYRAPAERMAVEAGVLFPAEEEINRQILVKRGVPPERIRLFGEAVVSTANEALALKKALDPKGKRILVVTSRYHARRARYILRTTLPGAEIRVVATPYEKFTRKWWSSHAMARAGVLETAKWIYYLLGGRFVSSSLDKTPHVG